MNYGVFPIHALCFQSLSRHFLWLESFGDFLVEQAGLSLKDLPQKHPFLFKAFGSLHHKNTKDLATVLTELSDLPPESIVTDLSVAFDRYEVDCFDRYLNLPNASFWENSLKSITSLFGRELAFDFKQRLPHLVSKKTVTLFEAITQTFCFSSHPANDFLLCRATTRNLQYEPRQCPHFRHARSSRGATFTDLICVYESILFKNFIHALVPTSHYERTHKNFRNQHYCTDAVFLQ